MVRFSLVMATALLSVASPLPLTHDTFEDCRVEPKGVTVKQPSEVPLLAYVGVANNVTVVLEYNDTNYTIVRDAVTLSNTVVTHSKVRDGQTTKATHHLQRLIPEGWNTFRLKVDEENLTVSLVMSEDWVTLLTLPLSRSVASVYTEGTRNGTRKSTVALCRNDRIRIHAASFPHSRSPVLYTRAIRHALATGVAQGYFCSVFAHYIFLALDRLRLLHHV